MDDKELFELELKVSTARIQLKQLEAELAYKKQQKEWLAIVKKMIDEGDAKIMDQLRKQYGG